MTESPKIYFELEERITVKGSAFFLDCQGQLINSLQYTERHLVDIPGAFLLPKKGRRYPVLQIRGIQTIAVRVGNLWDISSMVDVQGRDLCSSSILDIPLKT